MIRQLLVGCALAAVLASVAVTVRRGEAAWRIAARPPGTVTTTGCEEETFFSLWRAVHHEPVYVESARIPFASAYFNWLFYASYSAPLRPLTEHFGPIALVRFGRLFTAGGALLGALALFIVVRRNLAGDSVMAAAVASFVFLGPLSGWWAHTLRPDIWALACEVAGLAIFLLWHRRHPWGAALASVGFFFAAWSFKQTYLLGLGTTVVYLLVSRRWRIAATITLCSVALWIATGVIMGPTYQAIQQQTATNNVYYVATGLNSLADALVKSAPLLILAVGLFLPRKPADHGSSSDPFVDDARKFGLLGLTLSIPLTFIATCKQGATSNYFFTTAAFLAIACSCTRASPWQTGIRISGCLAIIGLQSLSFTGRVGQIDLTPQADRLDKRWRAFEQMPEPRFSSDRRLNQPWLNPHSLPLVLGYNYQFDYQAARPLEAGGVGGLIDRGYFASLLLPASTDATFLGGSLARYRRGEIVGDMVALQRIPQ